MRARTRPNINQIVGSIDSVLVMLHHQNRVPKLLKRKQCLDQTIVITLMESDRGFIKHVECTHEPRTKL